jgi:phosphoserine phosphatase
VAEVTERAMAGELDFEQSLRQRVSALQGTPVAAIESVRSRVRLTPGARTLCRVLNSLGYRLALVSGGFAEIVGPLAEELGVHRFRANTLEVADGRLTGRVVPPVVDRAGKARALREFAGEFGFALSRTVAIGDGANDLDMIEAAGLGIAFNAKPAVAAAADASVTAPYLDSVLYLLGISREQVEALS